MLAHRFLGGRSSSVSVSRPSLGSALIAAARARLWSSFRWCSESPLLAHPGTMVSRLLGSSRLFPGLPPASCGTIAPFSLCSRSQPQSSPWDPNSEARVSAPSPRPTRRVSIQASRGGECCSAPILCAGISLLCPPHPCGYALLHGSEASPLHPPAVSACKVCGNLSSFTAPSHWCRSRTYSFASVFSFFFCPTQVCGGVSCLLGGLKSSASV